MSFQIQNIKSEPLEKEAEDFSNIFFDYENKIPIKEEIKQEIKIEPFVNEYNIEPPADHSDLNDYNGAHCTSQVISPEKFCAKQMVLKNVIRTFWGMQKSKMQKHIMCPLRGLVQHMPKNPPNLGRMGCLCQLLSPKRHMI